MKKFIRTYLPFTSNEVKRNLAYTGAFYLFIFCSLFGTFINYYLWMAIFGSSGKGILGGFTQNEMIIYVFMSYITSSFAMISISEEVSEDVVKGTVAMNLIKPIDYRTSIIARGFGNSIYRFLIPNIFVWIGLEVYKVFVLHLPMTSIANIAIYLVSSIFSFLIYVLFDFCFGMIAFFTTYIFGMQMAKDALLSFLTGQLIPLSFFPGVVQRVFDFLPFSSMVYTPVMIYLGKYDTTELLFVLARQVIWIVILYVLGSIIWKKVTKRLIVLGG